MLIAYEALLEEVGPDITLANYQAATHLLQYPQRIRGYGHVKQRSIAETHAEVSALKEAFLLGEVRQAAE